MQNEHIHTWRIIFHYLHKHNGLTLQGIGTFLAEPNETIVDPVAKIITPGCKTISFHSDAGFNSPDFISFYHQLSGLSEPSILNKIADISVNLQNELLLNSKLIVDGCGTFCIDSSKIITFKAEAGNTFFDDSFGLSPIHFAANLSKVKRIIVEKTSVAEFASEDLTQMRESALRELKLLLNQAKIAQNISPAKSSKVFPFIATVLTLVLLINLALFLFKNPVSPLGEQVSKMDLLGKSGEILDSPSFIQIQAIHNDPVPVQNLSSTLTMETMCDLSCFIHKDCYDFDSTNYTTISSAVETISPDKLSAVENFDTEATNNNIKNSEELKEIVVETEIEQGYYLIAGAFKGIKKANKLVKELIAMGHLNPIIIKPAGYKYNLVAYQKFVSLDEAKTVQSRTQEDENWDVWIYTAH